MNINKEDILKIINEVDPADLVPGIVTPDDEYESEVNEIIRMLPDNPDILDLEARLISLFAKQFGGYFVSSIDLFIPRLKLLAQELIKLNQK
jgi:hypothetical protein